MQDFENLVMLMCAAVASMGVGVLVAYLVCKVIIEYARLEDFDALMERLAG